MDQAGQHIFEFLRHYGYFAMLPLMTLEGPVVTLISAMLASMGAFFWPWVFVLSVLGDMLGDVILYWIGYKYGMHFVRKIGKHIGITESLVLRMEKYFTRHGGKTIFAVKSTVGLCWATFTAAGIVKMDFKKFLKYSFLGGIVWSGSLVAMGYFYGYLWKSMKEYISWAGWIITAVAVASFMGITLYKKYQSRQLLRENNNSN
ncbi:MAG TPA: DedA family protein [Candidatus Moranbacteria bacterium]|nr:DedA family protein [Candidatus Moranbacteria bacterium]HRY28340.1 DedA family protein [Candidatus Moranbacteria bacterium]HSA07940.1 DedA family protein [Candidatus Moranbacteria bacterium]